MASEPRLVILQPKRELRIMKIRARQAGIREGMLMAGVCCAAVEVVAFITWLVVVVRSDPLISPAPGWSHGIKWVELAAAIFTVLVISGVALYHRRLSTEKLHISRQREPCVLTEAELQQLAAQLEAACDAALAESTESWDDTLLILQLRYQGYTQLLEAQSGVQTDDSFKRTLAEVEAVRVRLVQRRQTIALAT